MKKNSTSMSIYLFVTDNVVFSRTFLLTYVQVKDSVVKLNECNCH